MAYFQGTIRSRVMTADTMVNVILPDSTAASGAPRDVLYLLHGYGGTAGDFPRFTNIERLAAEKNVAVVMPEVGYSYYQDMAFGKRYFTYLTQELPEVVGNLFHVDIRPGSSWVAGVSMGGYGALKCLLAYPERYAACASISGIVDIRWGLDPLPFNCAPDAPGYNLEERRREAVAIYGKEPAIADDQDLYRLAAKTAEAGLRPRIYGFCGEQDNMLGTNRDFEAHLKSLGLDFPLETYPGGHDWGFFQRALERTMELFFPNPGQEGA